MTYKDLGFRPLYHNFTVLELTDNLKQIIEDFPGHEDANSVLVYGYIDHEAGFTFEVLEAGKINDDEGYVSTAEGNAEIRAFIRAEAVEENALYNMSNNAEMLMALHEDKIKMLNAYLASDEIEESRGFDFLDNVRHPEFIDDVFIVLAKEGLESEGCWVRIEGLSDHEIIGKLLNEPDQDFGCHMGDMLSVNIEETDEGQIIAYVIIE